MPSLLGSPPSVPPPYPVETSSSEHQQQQQQQQQRPFPDPNRLAPEDAYCAQSLKARAATATSTATSTATANYDGSLRTLKGNQSAAAVAALRLPNADGGRKVRDTSRRRRRRKGAWKKLLWVKQSCTFLSLRSFDLGRSANLECGRPR